MNVSRLLTRICGLLLAATMLLSVTAAAQQESIQAQQTTIEFSGKVDLRGNGKEWGLSKSEWKKYKQLMRGEAGLFYAKATPQYVLAVYEEDMVKKREYAKMSLEQSKKRHEQTAEIFALQEAILKQEYGLVRGERGSRKKKAKKNSWWKNLQNKRARIFVTADCGECNRLVQKVLKDGEVNIDFYLVGANSNDEIRAWATKLKMPFEKIQSKAITLNHGNELARRLLVEKYPTAFLFDGENYELVSEGK